MPHAFAFVDPLFSTGIAWSLRAVERLGLLFENAKQHRRLPSPDELSRYEALLAAEADQIDRVVAGAYAAMAQFDVFAAQAMLYFVAVSFAEVRQRLSADESTAWSGFLGADDPLLAPLPRESLSRLRTMNVQSRAERDGFVSWMHRAISPRNVAGLADPQRRNLYPVDLEALMEAHARLGLTRDQLRAALPALRGQSPEPVFAARVAGRSISRSGQPSPAQEMPVPR
jgi:FADH2 O2-dependent halogenase